MYFCQNYESVCFDTLFKFVDDYFHYRLVVAARPSFIQPVNTSRCVQSIGCIKVALTTLITFYIYAFSRRFYPKRLTVHSGYTYFCQYMCSLGIEPTTFALLRQCSTTEPQEHDNYNINKGKKGYLIGNFLLIIQNTFSRNERYL